MRLLKKSEWPTICFYYLSSINADLEFIEWIEQTWKNKTLYEK